MLVDLTSGDWLNRSALRKGYEAHNARVRSLAAGREFLEFQVQNGWEPLCKFLGKPVPQKAFPRVNEGNNAANIIRIGVLLRVSKMVAKPAAAVLVAWAVWRYGRRA